LFLFTQLLEHQALQITPLLRGFTFSFTLFYKLLDFCSSLWLVYTKSKVKKIQKWK